MARAKGIPALELYRLAQKKKCKLVLCGHSLGGAVSILAYFISSFVCVNQCNNEPHSLIFIIGSSTGHTSHFKGYCCVFTV